MTKRRRIVGVSWRKLQESPNTPGRRQRRGKASGSTDIELEPAGAVSGNIARVMTRMMSFRETFDTLRQKIKLPSRSNRKRLTNATPSPFGSVRKNSTPGSSGRKLSYRSRQEVKMYSPFEIVTPVRTPANSIKMGTKHCRRFALRSPGYADLDKEVTSLVDGMQTLAHPARSTSSPICPASGRAKRVGIRTTPKGSQSQSKKPLFV